MKRSLDGPPFCVLYKACWMRLEHENFFFCSVGFAIFSCDVAINSHFLEGKRATSILDTSQDMTGITIPSHVLSFESIYLPAVKCVSTKFVGEIFYKDWIMMRVRNKAVWWFFSGIHSLIRRAWWSHFHHISLCSETRDDLILFTNKRHYSYLYYKNRPLIWKDSLITS